MCLQSDQLKSPLLAISYSKPETHHGYTSAKMSACPAWRDESNDIRCFSKYRQYPDRFYQSLRLQTYVSADSKRQYADSKIAYFDPYSVNAEEAEMMHKTLQRIRRQMSKFNDKFAYPETFGGEINRLAWIVGAKEIWIWRTEKTGVSLKPADAIEVIDQDWMHLQTECQIKAGTYDGVVKCFTTAPVEYDGFGTVAPETREIKGQTVRLVEIEGRYYRWQVDRYRSGLYLTTRTEAEITRYLK